MGVAGQEQGQIESEQQEEEIIEGEGESQTTEGEATEGSEGEESEEVVAQFGDEEPPASEEKREDTSW